MQEYAVIGKLRFEDIPNAKTLKLGYYNGLPFAVSKDYDPDALYVIFLPDGQLSKEYAEQNDLIRRRDPETGEIIGGFFDENRKVKTLKLMKGTIHSVGYIATLASLAYTGYPLEKLEEGMAFNELNGKPICQKYINTATRRQQLKNNSGVKPKREERGLSMHPDTSMFYRLKGMIQKEDLLTITLKLDGTSFRAGNAYEDNSYNFILKMLSKFLPLQKDRNSFLCGTRRVILQRSTGNSYYNDSSLYLEVGEQLKEKLSPGEAIYGEIVGWLSEDKPLFQRGKTIFKYGCLPGERDFYVYNITYTLPNGQIVNPSWKTIQQRCQELHLKTVPTLVKPFFFDGNVEELTTIVETLTEGPDLIDSSHIREGVVIRVERGNHVFFLKSKSATFYNLEHESKSDDSYIDIEESQDV